MANKFLKLALNGDAFGCENGEPIGVLGPFASMIQCGVVPLFSRSYATDVELGSGATFARASGATVVDHEGIIRTALDGEARFQGGRRVHNLFTGFDSGNGVGWGEFTSGSSQITYTETSATIDSPNATDRAFISYGTALAEGSYVVSFDLSDIGIVPLNQLVLISAQTASVANNSFCYCVDSSNKLVRHSFDVTAAGNLTIRIGGGSTNISRELITYSNFMLQNKTGASAPTVPDDYVSVGVLSAPYHGANVDGVRYFPTENGNTVDGNGIVTEGTGALLDPAPALLMEPAADNYLLNSTAPATQPTASLATGDYVLWVEGTGSAAVTAGTATITGGGTATEGTPDLFTVTGAGTVTVTVTGDLDVFQLEGGSVPTSLIITAGAPESRAVDELSYPGIPADNETRAVVDGADVDVDDWDGVVDATLLGADDTGSVSSIIVYTTGDRPA